MCEFAISFIPLIASLSTTALLEGLSEKGRECCGNSTIGKWTLVIFRATWGNLSSPAQSAMQVGNLVFRRITTRIFLGRGRLENMLSSKHASYSALSHYVLTSHFSP